MGSKYTTLATSGYNSSPPADDGSQVAANLISWATQKTKLTDPVKTLADAINSALVTAFDYSIRQITASDNTVAGDHMKCVEIAPTVTTAVTVSLGDATTMTNNYRVFVKNSSARNQTVSRVTGGDTIDGVAGSITLPPLAGAIFQTTTGASGYLTVAWFGPTSDGTAIVAGGTDGTKKVRVEADGLTTGTTRVITMPDMDVSLVSMVVKRKTADESVTGSTTVQDDDHLLFAIGANEEWCATFNVIFESSVMSTCGFKTTLTFPAGSTQAIQAVFSPDPVGLGAGKYITTSGATLVNTVPGGGSTQVILTISVWALNGATPGNVTFQWAQSVSNGTALTARKGSFLTAQRIA